MYYPEIEPAQQKIGDSHLELIITAFFERCDDIISYVMNYFAVNFEIDYQNASGDISNFYPDLIVKRSESEIVIVETKGRLTSTIPLEDQTFGSVGR